MEKSFFRQNFAFVRSLFRLYASEVASLAERKQYLEAVSFARQVSLTLHSSPELWDLYGVLYCNLALGTYQEVLFELAAQLDSAGQANSTDALAEAAGAAVEIIGTMLGSECVQLAQGTDDDELKGKFGSMAAALTQTLNKLKDISTPGSGAAAGTSETVRSKRSAHLRRQLVRFLRAKSGVGRRLKRSEFGTSGGSSTDAEDGLFDALLSFTEVLFNTDQVQKQAESRA